MTVDEQTPETKQRPEREPKTDNHSGGSENIRQELFDNAYHKRKQDDKVEEHGFTI